MLRKISHRHTCAECKEKIYDGIADVETLPDGNIVFRHVECLKNRGGQMISRRTLLKSIPILAASAYLSNSVARPAIAQPVNYIPKMWSVVQDTGNICVEEIGNSFPIAPGVQFLSFTIDGEILSGPQCLGTPASSFVGGKGFDSNIMIKPDGFLRSNVGTTPYSYPYNPVIDYTVLKEKAGQVMPAGTQKITQILGVWIVDRAAITPVLGNQIPDTPVDWGEWRDAQTADKIDDINVKEFGSNMPLVLRMNDDLLYRFPSINAPKATLGDICPQLRRQTLYNATLGAVFPVFEPSPGGEIFNMWALITHTDATVKETCGGLQDLFSYIRVGVLLSAVPARVRQVAEQEAMRDSKVYRQNFTFVPVGGGAEVRAIDTEAAQITIGILVIIVLFAIIAGQPEILLIAAAA